MKNILLISFFLVCFSSSYCQSLQENNNTINEQRIVFQGPAAEFYSAQKNHTQERMVFQGSEPKIYSFQNTESDGQSLSARIYFNGPEYTVIKRKTEIIETK